jgi:hypothetical protein
MRKKCYYEMGLVVVSRTMMATSVPILESALRHAHSVLGRLAAAGVFSYDSDLFCPLCLTRHTLRRDGVIECPQCYHGYCLPCAESIRLMGKPGGSGADVVDEDNCVTCYYNLRALPQWPSNVRRQLRSVPGDKAPHAVRIATGGKVRVTSKTLLTRSVASYDIIINHAETIGRDCCHQCLAGCVNVRTCVRCCCSVCAACCPRLTPADRDTCPVCDTNPLDDFVTRSRNVNNGCEQQ